MDTIHRVDRLEVEVNIEEVARSLGYVRGEAPKRVASLIAEAQTQAANLLEPRCVYRRMRRHDLSHSPYLYHVDAAALCLVTIGPRLEAAVEAYKREGDLSRALVLDAYGSAAAEAAADAANAIIEREICGKGMYCSPRFSPGYACWDIKEQSWIVSALEGQTLGVTLTEGFMMVPRKSISFAVVFGESPRESRHEHTCDVCGMVECLYKRPD